MCDDPAASNPFVWQLHRATLKDLVSARGVIWWQQQWQQATDHFLCLGQHLVLAQSCHRRCADVLEAIPSPLLSPAGAVGSVPLPHRGGRPPSVLQGASRALA